MSSKPAKNSSLQVALIYSAAGIVWIFLSDLISNLFFHDMESMILFQISKGLLFVGLTAVLIYFLVNKQLKRKNQLINFLNRSEHWYNVMLSNIPKVEVFLFSPEGKIILSQGKVLASHGIDISLFAGKALDDIDLSMRTKAFFSPRIKSLLKGKSFNEVFEYEQRYYDVNGKCLRNDKSELFAGLLVVTDVTEIYSLIAELKESSKRLEDLNNDHSVQNLQLIEQNVKLKELNQKIKFAQERAEESDRLKTAFLTNMSHEIRTPLNGIIGFSQILLANSVSKEETYEYSKIIAESGVRLLYIIDDVLLLSQMQTGDFMLNTECITYKKFVNDIKYSIHHFVDNRLSQRAFNFIVDDETQNLKMDIDVSAMKKVLSRLVDNAIKFSEDNSKIEVSLQINEANYLEIIVKDEGIGMPKSAQNKIYGRFVQISNDTLVPAAGNGLGLSIVKELLNMMNASIEIESEEGVGTKFILKIPNVVAPNEITARTMNSNETLPKARKILIVEDVLDNFILLKAYFKRYNVKLYHAACVKEAEDFLKNNTDIDLILMDIRLPDGTGIELAEKLRADGVEIPIIAQTAYADSKDKYMCMKAGCNDYLAKPILKSQLIEIVNRFVLLESIHS